MPKSPKPKVLPRASKPKPELKDPGQQLVSEQISDNKLVAECPHCKHIWLEIIKGPMAVNAFAARLNGASICPKCGQSGAYMLLGDRYKEELAKLEPAKFRAEAIAKADLVVDPHDDGTEAVAVAETQRDADHKYYVEGTARASRAKPKIANYPFTTLWIKAFADFRGKLRSALFDYYPNNLGSSDEELYCRHCQAGSRTKAAARRPR